MSRLEPKRYDSKMSRDTMSSLLKTCNQSHLEDELMALIDKNKDGFITFDEFDKAMEVVESQQLRKRILNDWKFWILFVAFICKCFDVLEQNGLSVVPPEIERFFDYFQVHLNFFNHIITCWLYIKEMRVGAEQKRAMVQLLERFENLEAERKKKE